MLGYCWLKWLRNNHNGWVGLRRYPYLKNGIIICEVQFGSWQESLFGRLSSLNNLNCDVRLRSYSIINGNIDLCMLISSASSFLITFSGSSVILFSLIIYIEIPWFLLLVFQIFISLKPDTYVFHFIFYLFSFILFLFSLFSSFFFFNLVLWFCTNFEPVQCHLWVSESISFLS